MRSRIPMAKKIEEKEEEGKIEKNEL